MPIAEVKRTKTKHRLIQERRRMIFMNLFYGIGSHPNQKIVTGLQKRYHRCPTEVLLTTNGKENSWNAFQMGENTWDSLLEPYLMDGIVKSK